MRGMRQEPNERCIDVEALDVNLEQKIRRIWEALITMRQVGVKQEELECIYDAASELSDSLACDETHLSSRVAFELGMFMGQLEEMLGRVPTDALHLMIKKFFENNFSFDVRIFGLDEGIEFSKTLDELVKDAD